MLIYRYFVKVENVYHFNDQYYAQWFLFSANVILSLKIHLTESRSVESTKFDHLSSN